MCDIWKSALEWYIYYTDRPRKAKYAMVIMTVKDRLSPIQTKAELSRHYAQTEGLSEAIVAQLFPYEEWLDTRQIEDVAYGLRSLELSTGKKFDLLRQTPSRWLIETVA